MKTRCSMYGVIALVVCLAWAGSLCAQTDETAGSGPAPGQTLLEYYNTADRDALNADTDQMSENLKGVFRKRDIVKTESALEFSRYQSNFKNAILYANRLSGYVDYKANITFGRDNAVYQAMPEEGELTDDTRRYISEKYDRLETISGEEVLTYQEMLEKCFDVCELYADALFWGESFYANERFKKEMDDFFDSDQYRTYEQEKRPLLQKQYPEYVSRIDQLVASWREPPPDPESPIIDPAVVGRL